MTPKKDPADKQKPGPKTAFTAPLNLFVEPEFLVALNAAAKEAGVSRSKFVRDALIRAIKFKPSKS